MSNNRVNIDQRYSVNDDSLTSEESSIIFKTSSELNVPTKLNQGNSMLSKITEETRSTH